MRIATVLSLHDLPSAELQAGVLDGELARVGSAFCAIDAVIGVEQRAASIASEVPDWAIAETLTAAWVFGILEQQPQRLQLCVTSQRNIRPFSSPRYAFREVVLSEHEIVELGGLLVTTPLRTALDLARTEPEFSAESCRIVRGLASLGSGFDVDDCITALNERRNLPHKRIALTRLAAALAEPRGSSARVHPIHVINLIDAPYGIQHAV